MAVIVGATSIPIFLILMAQMISPSLYMGKTTTLKLTSTRAGTYYINSYTPIFALALFATVIFLLSFLTHTYQVWRYRSWYFTTVPVALILEVVGYIFRTLSAHVDPYRLIFFILQYFFIVTAPVLLSAGIYTILSVMINRVGRQYSPLPPNWILGVFITCDTVATIVQITGAALVGSRYSNDEDPTSANYILLSGLAFQVFTFLVFITITTLFLYRCLRDKILTQGRKMYVFIAAFLLATLLVYLRTCFRLAETSQGLEENLSTHEVYFACLEFAPIAGAVLLFNIWHPGRCLGRPVHADL
jgi:hypothetical protein